MKPLLLRPETAWLKDACQSPQERPCRRTLSLESQFASGEIGDKFQIGFEEVIREQFGRLGPLHVAEDAILQFSSVLANHKKAKLDGAAAAVFVADAGHLIPDGSVDSEFLLEFALQGTPRLFALLNLAAGEFPLEGHGLVAGALADEDLAVLHDQSCNDTFHRTMSNAVWGPGPARRGGVRNATGKGEESKVGTGRTQTGCITRPRIESVIMTGSFPVSCRPAQRSIRQIRGLRARRRRGNGCRYRVHRRPYRDGTRERRSQTWFQGNRRGSVDLWPHHRPPRFFRWRPPRRRYPGSGECGCAGSWPPETGQAPGPADGSFRRACKSRPSCT